MYIGTFDFEDGIGSFLVFRMTRNSYRGILIGRRVTLIGQMTFFKGYPIDKNALTAFFGKDPGTAPIQFANALMTNERLMPLMGPGPIIRINPKWDIARLMEEGTVGTLTMDDGEVVKMNLTSVREDPGSLYRPRGGYGPTKRRRYASKGGVAKINDQMARLTSSIVQTKEQMTTATPSERSNLKAEYDSKVKRLASLQKKKERLVQAMETEELASIQETTVNQNLSMLYNAMLAWGQFKDLADKERRDKFIEQASKETKLPAGKGKKRKKITVGPFTTEQVEMFMKYFFLPDKEITTRPGVPIPLPGHRVEWKMMKTEVREMGADRKLRKRTLKRLMPVQVPFVIQPSTPKDAPHLPAKSRIEPTRVPMEPAKDIDKFFIRTSPALAKHGITKLRGIVANAPADVRREINQRIWQHLERVKDPIIRRMYEDLSKEIKY